MSSEILSRSEIFKIVERSQGTSDFELISFEIKNAGDSPLGFNGEHKKAIVDVKLNNEKKKLTYFVKITPGVPAFKAYVDKTRSFYKEIGIYETMFQDFKNDNKTKWRPECYYARGADLIVMEDLMLTGYEMLPERTLLDEEHVLASLDAIAIMHAAPIIFEDRFNKKKVKTLSEKYVASGKKNVTVGDVYEHLLFETEASGDPSHPGHLVYETGIKAQTSLVELLPGYTEQEREYIKKKLPDELRRIYELVKPSDKYKNVIVHADLWLNNFLFRKEEDGKPKAVIIDFQIARFAPPAHDVTMFLHLVQEKPFRDSKNPEMFRYYHDRLGKELSSHGLNIGDILPWEEFLESCEFYKELAILTAIYYFQMIIAPGEICADFLTSPEVYGKIMFSDRTNMIQKCFLTDEIYRRRMTEAMDELIRGYIL